MEKSKNKKITLESLATMVARGFTEVRSDVKTEIENLRQDLRKEMNYKFEGVNRRLDDIALNRVKYEDFSLLKTRVDKIEKKLLKK